MMIRKGKQHFAYVQLNPDSTANSMQLNYMFSITLNYANPKIKG